jgi:hypothetical protein
MFLLLSIQSIRLTTSCHIFVRQLMTDFLWKNHMLYWPLTDLMWRNRTPFRKRVVNKYGSVYHYYWSKISNMKKIIKHYPMTDRLIVIRWYHKSVLRYKCINNSAPDYLILAHMCKVPWKKKSIIMIHWPIFVYYPFSKWRPITSHKAGQRSIKHMILS